MISRKHGLTEAMASKLVQLASADLSQVVSDGKNDTDAIIAAVDLLKACKSLASSSDDAEESHPTPKVERKPRKPRKASGDVELFSTGSAME